jgi:hypothetical protein
LVPPFFFKEGGFAVDGAGVLNSSIPHASQDGLIDLVVERRLEPKDIKGAVAESVLRVHASTVVS